MKNKLLTLASLLAAFNLNAIEIGPTGSGVEMSGFVVLDHTNQDTTGSDSAFMTSEVELNFDFTSGPVAFALDLEAFKGTGDANSGVDTFVEEAVVTYTFNDNLSMSAGRMLSYLGFEAYDAPNMYQISGAYSTQFSYLYDAYADGVSLDYGADDFSIGIWAGLEDQSSFEYAFAYTGIENLTAKYIYADYGGSDESKQTIWASYSVGSLLLAAEAATHENGSIAGATNADSSIGDTDAYLIMANYGITDKLSLTVRYSETEDDVTSITGTGGLNSDGSAPADATVERFTVSPTYMVTDDLALLAEYTDINDAEEFVGIELIFTF